MAKFSRDEELEKLEEDIRILKNKYDQFFAGISKYPPMQDRRMIEIFVHELSKQKIRSRRDRYVSVVTHALSTAGRSSGGPALSSRQSERERT